MYTYLYIHVYIYIYILTQVYAVEHTCEHLCGIQVHLIMHSSQSFSIICPPPVTLSNRVGTHNTPA